MALAAEGLTAIRTAKNLWIGHETIKSYRKRILKKLDAKNMTHAVAIAIRNGWI